MYDVTVCDCMCTGLHYEGQSGNCTLFAQSLHMDVCYWSEYRLHANAMSGTFLCRFTDRENQSNIEAVLSSTPCQSGSPIIATGGWRSAIGGDELYAVNFVNGFRNLLQIRISVQVLPEGTQCSLSREVKATCHVQLGIWGTTSIQVLGNAQVFAKVGRGGFGTLQTRQAQLHNWQVFDDCGSGGPWSPCLWLAKQMVLAKSHRISTIYIPGDTKRLDGHDKDKLAYK